MRNLVIYLAMLASVMSACSKKLVPMQKDWADQLGSKTSEVLPCSG